MKKIISSFLLLLFLILSIYFTDKYFVSLRNNDPIMKEILESNKKYKIDSIDAIIDDNTIISGKKGREVDVNKSYSKMKKYGVYNETYTILSDVSPTISIDDNYDKYIIGGNKNNKYVSFVFILKDNINIDKLLKILDKSGITVTFFIDGKLLENNITKIKSISKKHEIEILSYNDEYDESLFNTSISYLNNILNKNYNYCYSEIDNRKLLDICSKNKIHTIKPSLLIKKNLYNEIRNNLSNSIIISIDNNSNNIKDLYTSIDYIKRKGYKIVSVNHLIKE